ncbi:hypothetical protein BDW22DRAFT_1346420 [Trametopsis cervina]|nr:hypothetical protein BDW22DRAFT_1346420 [Trametopsis cervina]
MSSLQSIINGVATPMLFGINVSMILYGLFLAQVVYYWTTYENDRIKIKVWVGILFMLETCHTAVCMHMLYFYLVLHYGDFQNGLTQVVCLSHRPLFILSCLSVDQHRGFDSKPVSLSDMAYEQSQYHGDNDTGPTAHNTSRDGHMYVSTVDSWVSKVADIAHTDSNSFTFIDDTWESLKDSNTATIATNVTWVLAVVNDLTIFLLLLYYLYLNRSVGSGRTRRIVRGLLHYSLTTGALTMVCSVTILITFNTNKDTVIYAAFVEVLGKLYANSVLAMLNARQLIVSKAEKGGNNNLELSRLRYVPPAALNILEPIDAVHVTEERIQFSDHTLSVESDKKGGGSAMGNALTDNKHGGQKKKKCGGWDGGDVLGWVLMDVWGHSGWLRSGDEVVLEEDGNIAVVDRIKELIKVKGLQVSPAELERHLLIHPDVADVGVVGVPDDYAGELPVGFIVLKDAAKSYPVEDERGKIAKHVQDAKSRYKWLKEAHFVDAIPRNPSGKILRRVLRDEVGDVPLQMSAKAILYSRARSKHLTGQRRHVHPSGAPWSLDALDHGDSAVANHAVLSTLHRRTGVGTSGVQLSNGCVAPDMVRVSAGPLTHVLALCPSKRLDGLPNTTEPVLRLIETFLSGSEIMSYAHIAIGGVANPILFGTNLSMILYGLFLAQAAYYWTTYESDNIKIKVWVGTLLVFVTCHTAVCLHMLHFYLVLHYGDSQNSLEQVVWL